MKILRFSLMITVVMYYCICAVNGSERKALVIANNAYQASYALPKTTITSAEALSSVLMAMDVKLFRGRPLTNLNFHDFESSLDEFAANISYNDIAFFYYGGHGFSDSFENYLLPIDGDPEDADKIIKVQTVLQKLGERPSLGSVIFIDACRDNGPQHAFMTPSSPSPNQVLVVYSSQPGSRRPAESVFAWQLKENIAQPGTEIHDIIRDMMHWNVKGLAPARFYIGADTLTHDILLREPVSVPVQAQVEGDLELLLNDRVVFNSHGKAPSSGTILLKSGRNNMAVIVYKDPNFPGQYYSGWSYSLIIGPDRNPPILRLEDDYDSPPGVREGRRQAKGFGLRVDPQTALVQRIY